MAGLQALGAKYLAATIEHPLNGYNGLRPLYCLTRVDGSFELVEGEYAAEDIVIAPAIPATDKTPEQPALTRPQEATDFYLGENAIAPKCAKGETVTRCTLTVRNPMSPDVKQFSIDNGFDPDAYRPNGHLTSFRDKDPMSEQQHKDYIAEVAYLTERNVIGVAALIVAINNVPSKDDPKACLVYNTETAIQVIRDLPLLVPSLMREVLDRKKFATRS